MDRLREALRARGVPDEQIEQLLSSGGQPPLSMMGGGEAPAPLALRPGAPSSPMAPPPPSMLGPAPAPPRTGTLSMPGGRDEIPPLSLGSAPATDSPYVQRPAPMMNPTASTGSNSVMPVDDRPSLGDKLRQKFEEVLRLGRPPPPMQRPEPKPTAMASEEMGPPLPEGLMKFTAADPQEGMEIPLLPGQEPSRSRITPYESIRGGGARGDIERLEAPISEVDEMREPWMQNARREQKQAEIDFQAQRDRLAAARQISEGLGKMQVPTTGEIRNRIAPVPYVAEGIRRKEAEWAEKITPQESEFYAAQGLRAPVGMPRGTVLKSVPSLGGLDYKRDYLQWQREKEGGVQARFDESQGRLKDTQKYRRQRDARSAVAAERSDWLRPTSYIGKLRNQLKAASTVEKLARQDNPVATRAAMVKLAKELVGDTGVLTQLDIDAYEGRIGLPGWITSVEKFFSGDFTPEQKQNLIAVAQEMIGEVQKKYEEEAEARIASFEAANADQLAAQGIDEEKLRKMLGAPARGGLAPPPAAEPAPAGATSATPAPVGTASGKIRVRLKVQQSGPNGQIIPAGTVGNIMPNEWDPNLYEKL